MAIGDDAARRSRSSATSDERRLFTRRRLDEDDDHGFLSRFALTMRAQQETHIMIVQRASGETESYTWRFAFTHWRKS